MLFIKNIIIIIILSSLYSCKKDAKTPEDSGPKEEPDFTLQASDVNYPIGTSWVYSVKSQTTSASLSVQAPPNIQNSATSTFTLKVVYDSIMSGNVTGKVLQYFLDSGINGTLKELQYVNYSTNLWHQVLFGSVNGNSITPGGMAVRLPLANTGGWKNPYYPNQSNLDTCYVTGYKNLQLDPGYLKCINFMSLGMGNSYKNEYWYNKAKGLVKEQSAKYSFPDPNTMVSETSTITIIKFN